jgi:hypothetical protein
MIWIASLRINAQSRRKRNLGGVRVFISCSHRLACIAHKSLEISERCRLWQQNYPATPDYSAAFFGEKEFEAVCFGSFILKLALK